MTAPLPRSKLRVADIATITFGALRRRPARTALSVAGITVGIAAIVSVLGITEASNAAVVARIDALGTDLLAVEAGQSLGGDPSQLAPTAPQAIGHLTGVVSVSGTAGLSQVFAYRNDRVPPGHTEGLTVRVADSTLIATTHAALARGKFPAGPQAQPLAVLGASAARVLGDHGRIWVGGHWFTIAGVLAPHGLVPELNESVLVGPAIAASYFRYDGIAERVYVRTTPESVIAVSRQLARAANPIDPSSTKVTRPSDAVAARLAVTENNRALLLGLGSVALLVGALGIANTMVVSVIEQRARIGLRRALGATRTHIATQFICEAFALSILGGLGGIVVGLGVTAATAWSHGWQPTVNAVVAAASLGLAAAAGVIAGAYPAVRASRLVPTDALRTV
jgi:putative ABC transport system permease protein